jgi:hypothetical protein
MPNQPTRPVQFGETPETILKRRPAASVPVPEGAPKPPMPKATAEGFLALNEAMEAAKEGPAPVDGAAEPIPLPVVEQEADEEEEFETSEASPWLTGLVWDRPEVRRRIEEKLKPLVFEELLSAGRVMQRVELRKGLTVMYQGLTGADGVFCKRMAAEAAIAAEVTYADLLTIMRLAVGIHAINGRLVEPVYEKSPGDFDADQFTLRWKMMHSYDETILGFLVRNQIWFEERLRRLSVLDDLKNG